MRQDREIEFVIIDGRQSETAAAVQRGVCRLLRSLGFATISELPLASGRRVDVMAVGPGGEIWVVEIKSSLADLRADDKWPEYEGFCDRLYFAIPPEMPTEIMPSQTGLMIADRWGATPRTGCFPPHDENPSFCVSQERPRSGFTALAIQVLWNGISSGGEVR